MGLLLAVADFKYFGQVRVLLNKFFFCCCDHRRFSNWPNWEETRACSGLCKAQRPLLLSLHTLANSGNCTLLKTCAPCTVIQVVVILGIHWHQRSDGSKVGNPRFSASFSSLGYWICSHYQTIISSVFVRFFFPNFVDTKCSWGIFLCRCLEVKLSLPPLPRLSPSSKHQIHCIWIPS